jgi:Uma2 family endonuclease
MTLSPEKENVMKPLKHLDKTSWTYGDYLNWPEDERWEIIDGEAYAMNAPNTPHQQVSRNLCFQIQSFLEGKPCEMFNAPYDVLLPKENEADEKIKTVVQPDIIVVCDPEKIIERGCRGAPDWVIEILSPSSSGMDHIRKRNLYERHGVKEYWVVQPGERSIWVAHFVGKRFSQAIEYFETDRVKVKAVPGLEIDLSNVFPPKPKSVREPPRRYI